MYVFMYVSCSVFEEFKAEMEELLAKGLRAYNAGLKEYQSYYHDDLVTLQPNQPVIAGKIGKA